MTARWKRMGHSLLRRTETALLLAASVATGGEAYEAKQTLVRAIDALCQTRCAAVDARGTPGFAAAEAEVATAQAAHDTAVRSGTLFTEGFPFMSPLL